MRGRRILALLVVLTCTTPGGFYYGDNTATDNSLAVRILNNFWDEIQEFLSQDNTNLQRLSSNGTALGEDQKQSSNVSSEKDAVADDSDISPRIIGGTAAKSGEFPYQVFLTSEGSVFCSGIIISEDFILTAQSCNRYGLSQFKVGAGNIEVTESSSTVLQTVTQVMEHEDLTNCPLVLMKLEKKLDVSGSNIKAINMRTAAVTSKVSCTASGWGTTSSSIMTGTSKTLIYVEVPIVLKEDCVKLLPSTSTLGDGEICAGQASGGKDVCHNDLGGPLVCEGVLTGVVNYRFNCGVGSQPSVYTDFLHCKPWIDKTLKDNGASVLHVSFLMSVITMSVSVASWL